MPCDMRAMVNARGGENEGENESEHEGENEGENESENEGENDVLFTVILGVKNDNLPSDFGT